MEDINSQHLNEKKMQENIKKIIHSNKANKKFK